MSKQLPSEVQQQIDEMTEQYREQLTELWQWVLDEKSDSPATALEIEQRIREWQRRIGVSNAARDRPPIVG